MLPMHQLYFIHQVLTFSLPCATEYTAVLEENKSENDPYIALLVEETTTTKISHLLTITCDLRPLGRETRLGIQERKW